MSIFMNYQDVIGETSEKLHRGWIDIDFMSWGVRRNITSHTSTRNDRESANAEITDLVLERRMDSATPALFIESCCGKGKTVVIHLTKTGTGTGSDVFMEYTLKNAVVSDYMVYASAQDPSRPLEEVTISFVDVEVKYTPYDEDGNAMAPIAVGFDTATNTKR